MSARAAPKRAEPRPITTEAPESFATAKAQIDDTSLSTSCQPSAGQYSDSRCTNEPERVVIGSVLAHGAKACGQVAGLYSTQFHSGVNGAAYHAALTVADCSDETARVLAACKRVDRLPPGYDLSAADMTRYLADATLTPEYVAVHVGEILEAYADRQARYLSAELVDRIERGHDRRDVLTEIAAALLDLRRLDQ